MTISQATVLSVTRRYTQLRLPDSSSFSAMVESRALEVTVGDQVETKDKNGEIVVSQILPRKNCLIRCYQKSNKRLVSNLDMLFIVTAVEPLFNTNFVDRISIAASDQNIPVTLVLNKIDLGIKNIASQFEYYKSLGFKTLSLSSKTNENLNEFLSVLSDPSLEIVALAGVSGVGKSSLLNEIIPAAARTIGTVSERTGQGKQTTSQSHAYPFLRSGLRDLLVVDLPGLSSYGLTHLSKERVRSLYAEFANLATQCDYNDCWHIHEPNCAVKTALERGMIAEFRYQSYLDILSEIEKAREY